MNQYLIHLPWTIPQGKKKTAINLNIYRNLHYRALHKLKIDYSRYILEQVKTLPICNSTLSIHYVLYPPSNRRVDLMNVVSITDKFFLDTLVTQGIITDDSYKYVTNISISFGSVNKEEPGVKAILTYGSVI